MLEKNDKVYFHAVYRNSNKAASYASINFNRTVDAAIDRFSCSMIYAFFPSGVSTQMGPKCQIYQKRCQKKESKHTGHNVLN